VILLHSKAADDLPRQIALMVCIVVVCGAGYLIFALSAHGAKWLNPIFLRLTTRIMGLLLAAIAIQFLLNALKELGLIKP
jgi:multiple antibiotic resistance protein